MPPPTPESEPQPPPPPSRRALFLLAFALLAAGFVLAVVAALHKPDYVVLVPMDETELAWFRPRLTEFGERNHVRLATRVYRDGAELERILIDDRREPKRKILAVLAPQDRLVALVDSALTLPLSSVDGTRLLEGFGKAELQPGQVNATPYYVPAAVTTLCLYYSKKRVAEAVEHWSEARPAIESSLRAANGTGLPKDYLLEPDPAQWNSYDLAVLASYWASKPFDGLTVPRVAHVTRPSRALALDLATRIHGMGASSDELLALDGIAVRDALAWESFHFGNGLYHPAMAKGGLDAQDVCASIAQDQVWLCALEPRELFRLHGLTDEGGGGFVRDAADLGVAQMPRGASLELTDRGSPSRGADPISLRDGLWWGVVARTPDAPLASKLIGHCTSALFQMEQARALGWMSARSDLADDLPNLYREPWRYEIARPVARQMFKSTRQAPTSPRWPLVQEALSATWQDACVTRHLTDPVDLAAALQPHTQALANSPPH